MTETELKHWFKNEQQVIEKIILEAAQKYVAKYEHLPNFGYDLAVSQKEAYNLINSLDLCYDRFTTPLAYSLWYQAKRINIFLSHFTNKILEAFSTGYPIDIFDLGAGTGCVQFCFGLSYVAQKRKGLKPLFFRIINVDLSPFMLEYLRSYLWPVALKYYPELKDLPVEYHIYSWSNKGDLKVINPWICASYLFDSSDNEEYLTTNFEDLINTFNPGKIMFLTSSQEKKTTLMDSLAFKMKSLSYQAISASSNSNVFSGNVSGVNEFRRSLISKYNLRASAYAVSWNDGSFKAVGLEKKQTGFVFDVRELPQELDLFNPQLKIRREVKLNEEQEKAAAFETSPAIITGPAGCGKSVVITEKILNILEHFQWSKNLDILVTTFNKGLIKQLRVWLTDILDAKGIVKKQIYYLTKNGIDDGTGEIIIENQFIIKIKFVHFEMLGKYIGKISYGPFDEKNHIRFLQGMITTIKTELKIGIDEMQDILNPDFLLEEYHRVVFGLGCKLSLGEDVYQKIERKGRGKKIQLQYDSLRRKAIWNLLYQYAFWMHTNKSAGKSFIARRQLFLNLLEGGDFKDKFDYVFVDEFQDCTPADYKIMMKMLHDVNNLVLAGDLAQSVHLGAAGTIPRDEEMARRIIHRLKGSYRLPYRISEAIQPFSALITKDSDQKNITPELSPSKGAPPGARPIVVYAEDDKSLGQKIIEIKNCYCVFELDKITILEKDNSLCEILHGQRQKVETTTILKLKGLEKQFIVWSLQAEVLFENEAKEFAYTIMTRTNCILVIVITPRYKQYNLEFVYQLRNDRLIYWDKETDNFLLKNFPV